MGKIIAVIGIDGSGKSTLISNLEFSSTHFYKKREMADVRSNQNQQVILKPTNSNMLKTFIFTIAKIYIPNLITLIHYRFFSKKNFIFDRYAYDYAGRLKNKKFYSRILNFLFHYFPSPDYVIFLDIDPALAFQRKPEFDVSFLAEKRKLLLQEIQHLSEDKLFIVDAAQPIKIKSISFLNNL